ncbi:Mob1/phocein, partial [Polychytrium aggregatum]|uniref:Mob1/phocein n=1 Tax=Polychytrium aggregatum TaxID=110093 RepID=UPI0022FE78AC
LFLEQPFVNATLVNGSLRKVCSLPRFVDSNEWLAVNTFDFFMHTNFFYDAVAEFCDEAGECAVMNGGPSFEYTWTDSQRRTVKLSAPQYVDSAMSWIQTVLYDEQIFPTKGTNPFPKDLQNTLRAIYKHLFRIFAHIYHCHYDKILHMSAEGHLNTLFAHVICFGREFDLLDKKELSPMSEFITELEKSGRI